MNISISQRSVRILIVLFLGVLMAAMDIAMLGPAKPAIQETFGIDERLGSWILNAFVLFNLMGVPVMSKMADIYGRRPVFLVVVVLFAAGGLLVATSQSFAMLLAGRCIQGLAASGIFPVAAAVTADTFPPSMRGRALGVLGAVFGLAFIIGPIIAGLLLQIGWRWIYFGYVPFAAVVGILGFLTIPPVEPRRHNPIDIKGVVLLTGMILSLTYGISQLDPGHIASALTRPRVFLSFLIFSILLPAFIKVEKRAADPVLRPTLFTNRQIMLASFLAIGAGMIEAAFISFPTLASLSMSVSRSEAAYMLIPLSIAIAVGSPVWGLILDRSGSRLVVVASNSLLFTGLVSIALWPAWIVVFYVATIMIGLGLAGIMGSALNYILIHEALESERTASQGVITLSISIGQLVGAAAVGAIVASMGGVVRGYSTAFLMIAAVVAGLTLLSFRLKSRAEEQKLFL